MISVEEALEKVLGTCEPLGTESAPLSDCLDRILAEPVVARECIPPAPLSAMDGYAVRSQDTSEEGSVLEVLGDIPAGTVSELPVGPGQTQKIFTGSVLPEGADAVIMVERSSLVEGDGPPRVRLEGAAEPRQHIREPGEVVTPGQQVLEAGVRIGPGHIGLLATLGYPEPRVSRRPRVGILPTGSELLEVHEALRPGMIRDSNSPALDAQVRRTGGIPHFLGVARDDRALLEDLMARGLEESDVLITSGGVSMGDYDFVGEILEKLGCTIHFTRVRTKPGKPVTFATRGSTQVFGLPGNPVSSMVSYELFCRPALRKRMGIRSPCRPRVEVTLTHPVRKGPDRRDYQRCRLEFRNGGWQATVTGPQGSGIMVSMAEAQALLELAEERLEFAAGERVPALLLDESLERETA